MTLDYKALRDLLTAAGLPAYSWQFPDVSYETVSADAVLDNWNAWLESRPAALVMFRDAGGKSVRERPLWIAEVSDCDNLALGTVAHFQVGNALRARRTGEQRGGLAYGFLFYTAGPARPENFGVLGGHSINWFVDHDSTVKFFEPGVGVVVDLNPTERSGAWFGLAA